MNTPANAGVVPGLPAGVGGHPTASDSQPDHVHAKEMLSSYKFSEDIPPNDLYVPPLQNTDCTNCSLDEKSVKIILKSLLKQTK